MPKFFLEQLDAIQIRSGVPPYYIFTLGRRDAFLTGLHFYCALTPLSRLKKVILKSSYGLLRSAKKTGLISNIDEEAILPVQKFLAPYISESYICNVYLPSYRKAIVQVVSPEGNCEKVIKVAFGSTDRDSMIRERDNLFSMEQFSFESFELPIVLNSGFESAPYFIEYSCPEKFRSYESTAVPQELITILHELFSLKKQGAKPITDTPLFLEILKRIDLQKDTRLKNRFTQVLDICAEKLSKYTIPVGIIHSDFKPWNILVNLKSNRLFIVDWESMRTDGLPLWDSYCYILFTYCTIHMNSNPQRILNFFRSQRKFFDQYVAMNIIDHRLIEDLLPLYLLDLLTTPGLWSKWEQKETRPMKIFSCIKRFLEHLCDCQI